MPTFMWQTGAPYGEAQKQLASKQNSRLAREYINALDAQNKDIAIPKNISLSDPQARWTAVKGGLAYFAYSTNYLIDIRQNIILDVEPTPAHRTLEVRQYKTNAKPG